MSKGQQHYYVHCSIHNSQDIETTQCPSKVEYRRRWHHTHSGIYHHQWMHVHCARQHGHTCTPQLPLNTASLLSTVGSRNWPGSWGSWFLLILISGWQDEFSAKTTCHVSLTTWIQGPELMEGGGGRRGMAHKSWPLTTLCVLWDACMCTYIPTRRHTCIHTIKKKL